MCPIVTVEVQEVPEGEETEEKEKERREGGECEVVVKNPAFFCQPSPTLHAVSDIFHVLDSHLLLQQMATSTTCVFIQAKWSD